MRWMGAEQIRYTSIASSEPRPTFFNYDGCEHTDRTSIDIEISTRSKRIITQQIKTVEELIEFIDIENEKLIKNSNNDTKIDT